VYLLKGNKKMLDAVNYRRIRIMGRLLKEKEGEFAVIEIEKMEALD